MHMHDTEKRNLPFSVPALGSLCFYLSAMLLSVAKQIRLKWAQKRCPECTHTVLIHLREIASQVHWEGFVFKRGITVFYNRYDGFFHTFNTFSKLLTHQHTYHTQLAKLLQFLTIVKTRFSKQ